MAVFICAWSKTCRAPILIFFIDKVGSDKYNRNVSVGLKLLISFNFQPASKEKAMFNGKYLLGIWCASFHSSLSKINSIVNLREVVLMEGWR